MAEQLHVVDAETCLGDGICAEVCPEDILELGGREGGHRRWARRCLHPVRTVCGGVSHRVAHHADSGYGGFSKTTQAALRV